MEKLVKYVPSVTLFIVLILFFKSCGTSTQIKNSNEELKSLNKKVDSLTTLVIAQDEMIKILKETPSWKTLEIEELSDKNNVPINHYKNEIEK